MYSPKIEEDLVRAMYQLKLKIGKSITKQANEAIAEYVEKTKEGSKDDILNTRSVVPDVSNQEGQALQNDVSKADTISEGR